MAAPSDVVIARIEALTHFVATDPSRWPEVIAALRQAFDARSAVLFTPDPVPGAAPFGVVDGTVVEGAQRYFQRWRAHDAWNQAVAGTRFFQRAGDVELGEAFTPDAALRRTAFFNDWARPYEAEQLVSLKVTDEQSLGAPVLHLTLFRRFADPAFDDTDRQVLRRLWPHLQQAAVLTWTLRPLHGLRGNAEKTVEMGPLPTWVVGETGKIAFANQVACTLMQAGQWAQSQHGAISRIGHLERVELERRIARGGTAAMRVVVSMQDEVCVRPGALHVLPIHQSPDYALAWPEARVLLMLEIPSLVRTDLIAWTARLAAHHGLTEAQREVLEGLGRSMTPQQIASQHKVDIRTIRAHLSALYARTGTSGQVDLVRLLGGL